MMSVNFLPDDFNPSLPIVILAGKGEYPKLIWERLEERKAKSYVFAFEYLDWISSKNEHYFEFPVGQVSTWLKALKKCRARYVILAGQITPKKLFHGLNPDLKALWLLARLKEKNATTIFGALIKEIEKLGIYVLDARSFLEDQLATLGDMTSEGLLEVPQEILDKNVEICRSVAALDIGQSIVVSRGTVVIAEAFDGTDAMIERAGDICDRPMGLIKLAKQNQDFRFDVPVFGLRTLRKMYAAKIHWAALEASRTILLNKAEVISEAERLKIRLFGI